MRPDYEQHNETQREYFEATVKRTMVPTGTPYVRRQVDEVMRIARIKAGDRVLDVGCGMGRYTLVLADRGVRVEGLDLSQVLLDRLDRFNGGRYEIPRHCADVMSPSAALEGHFDAVIGFFALHHMHDLDGCFIGMARLARPGGRVVFLEPNPYNPLYYIQIGLTPRMRWKRERGLLRMRRGRIFRACAAAGLARPSLSRFGFFPPFVVNRPFGGRLDRVCERIPGLRPFLPFQVFVAEKV